MHRSQGETPAFSALHLHLVALDGPAAVVLASHRVFQNGVVVFYLLQPLFLLCAAEVGCCFFGDNVGTHATQKRKQELKTQSNHSELR